MEAMQLSRTAIRAQLATLQHEGLVEQRGMRRGTSKPSRTYGVTAEAELMLSRAYVPLLGQLMDVLSDRVGPAELDGIMREVGKRLMVGRPSPHGTLEQKVQAASTFLNELGGTTEVEALSDHYLIRGHGCPLGAATKQHPEACTALESLVSELVAQPVTKCCDESERQRCCFRIARVSRGTPSARGS